MPFSVEDPTEAIGHDSVLVRGAPGTSTRPRVSRADTETDGIMLASTGISTVAAPPVTTTGEDASSGTSGTDTGGTTGTDTGASTGSDTAAPLYGPVSG